MYDHGPTREPTFLRDLESGLGPGRTDPKVGIHRRKHRRGLFVTFSTFTPHFATRYLLRSPTLIDQESTT